MNRLLRLGVLLAPLASCIWGPPPDDGSAGSGQTGNTLLPGAVCSASDPACTPTGAHARHAAAGYACVVCHKVGGRLAFDRTGPAYGPAGSPVPTFDATSKQCSNVACHSVPSGTFSYWFQGGDGEAYLNTVPYGGGAAGGTPSWYATANGCSGCHSNPPTYNGVAYVWHSGYHGAQGPSGERNQCQFCHPDAAGDGGIGRTITNPSLHQNGTVNVQAVFKSSCFGCH